MTEYQDLRDDLDSEVFTPYGKGVTFIKKSTPLYNDRGELESVTSTQSSATIVPYNIFNQKTNHEAFGKPNEGDMDAAVRYSVNVAKDDEFTIETETWVVREVQKNYLPENVVNIVRLTRKLYA